MSAVGVVPAFGASASFLGAKTACHWAEPAGDGQAISYGAFASIRPNAPGTLNEFQIGGAGAHPSEDEAEGPGLSGSDKVTYRVYGPDVDADDRPVLLPGGTTRRATTWTDSPVLTWDLQPGNYRLAVYAYDYTKAGIEQDVSVEVDGVGALTKPVTPDTGVYLRTLIEVPAPGPRTVTVSVSATSGNAVVSGVFLDMAAAPVSGVSFDGFDAATRGDWIGSYGTLASILAGTAAGGSPGSTQTWSQAKDDADVVATDGYSVAGKVFVWSDEYVDEPAEAPSFALAWTGWLPNGGDGRACTFWIYNANVGGPSTPGERRATTWDVDTPGLPLLIDLHVPANRAEGGSGFVLSLYAMDYDNNDRTQDVEIRSGNGSLLDAKTLTGSSFRDGVVLRWELGASMDYRIRVVPRPGTVATLSGIFLDEIVARPTPSPSASATSTPTSTPTTTVLPTTTGGDGDTAGTSVKGNVIRQSNLAKTGPADGAARAGIGCVLLGMGAMAFLPRRRRGWA
ncbi:MAG TPA: hypothetical protein VGB83_04550 [Actinomycetota bacterium]